MPTKPFVTYLPPLPGKPVPTMHESMLWTNLSGCMVALVLGLVTGHIAEGVAFCLKNPECMCVIPSDRPDTNP